LQAVKSLGLTGSRKLRTIKSKRRVCLICNNADNTNLETFIANEYLTPPTTGFAGTVAQSQAIQTSAASGVYLVTGLSATAQEVQSQDSTGVYLITGSSAQSQQRQTQDAIGDNNSIPVPSTGGHYYHFPRMTQDKRIEKPVPVFGEVATAQESQSQFAYGIYGFIAKGASRQAVNTDYARGVYKCIGVGDSMTKNISTAMGGVVSAEDELLIIMRLLEVA
jgi:hypothetical protein